MPFTSHDRTILRDLARRVADIAVLPDITARKARWTRHNDLQPVRPLILVFPEGAWRELLPFATMQCESEDARGIEWGLRSRLYIFEHFRCDNVIDDTWGVSKVIQNTGWGVEACRQPSTEALGAWHFEPVIHTAADLKKLRYPEIRYDEAATEARFTVMQELFGDILKVKCTGVAHISFHLMAVYTGLRGLEEVMMDMYEEPYMLHDAMAFLEEGHHRLVQQYLDLNLLELNNDDTYHNSGGYGYTDELPKADYNPAHVRPCDMWASAEAQEMALVSPEQHEEFILAYERRLLAPFGLTGYGCCEDLSQKLDYVLTIPHIRRISISPFANVDVCAEKLQGKAIFSWKPHPAHLVGQFDPAQVRNYIQHTIDICAEHGCILEMILKDTHTCEDHPERFDQWTDIAWELVHETTAAHAGEAV
ncbi:MAG: hypothetical protein BWY76_01179 [bacterium ADurb.Bin429]|nr:MAG: hypothetical protein BWY76_01179 [bacterium ADurb.Bin429]